MRFGVVGQRFVMARFGANFVNLFKNSLKKLRFRFEFLFFAIQNTHPQTPSAREGALKVTPHFSRHL